MKPEYSLKHLCEQQDRMYLLQEWDWNKNAPLTPDTIHKGSHQKVCGDATLDIHGRHRCEAGRTVQNAHTAQGVFCGLAETTLPR